MRYTYIGNELRAVHHIFPGVEDRSVCLLSLVVEHSLCKRKVGGSIPPVGCRPEYFFTNMGDGDGERVGKDF